MLGRVRASKWGPIYNSAGTYFTKTKAERIFKDNQLQIKLKRCQKANENFLGQPTRDKTKFLKFGVKKVNLATLATGTNRYVDLRRHAFPR